MRSPRECISSSRPDALHRLSGSHRARELLKQVESFSNTMYVSPVSRAMVHVGLGDHDLALKALEQRIREGDFRAIYLGTDSTWDLLRADPHFIKLLETVGLPQA